MSRVATNGARRQTDEPAGGEGERACNYTNRPNPLCELRRRAYGGSQ